LKYQFYILLLCLAGLSCSAVLKNTAPDSKAELKLQSVQVPAMTGSRLPRLRNLPNGDVLMSWVEPKGKGHELKFSVFHDGNLIRQGKVAQGENWFVNWADYPSVVAIDKQFWVAHWLVKQRGGKTFDYDVALAISNDAGNTWREIGHPHRDKGVAAEHGFVTIFADAGEAGIVWLDGREYVKKDDKVAGSNKTIRPEKSGNFNLRYTRIHRDGTMEAEQVLDDNTCTCCWTSVASTPKGAVVAWRGRTDDDIRDNRVALLHDGKWSAPAALGAEGWRIEGCPVNGPSVSARGMQVAAAWFTAEGDRPRVRAAFSKDGGKNFSKPVDIDEASPLGRIGIVWKDDNTAVISWMTATNSVSKKSSLALQTIYIDGRSDSIKHVLEVSSGRDTGVPQMISYGPGLMLAWTGISPTYGVQTALMSWDDLEYKNNFKSAFLSKITFLGHNTHQFTPIICGQQH
jgi:hypothetical protein